MPASLPEVGILSFDVGMQPSPSEESYWNSNNRKSRNWKNRGGNNYDQNDGRPGVVYILANDAFPHLLKVGQSTRSASVRARELNENCGTENPGRFSVLHEVRTADCGRAEKRAHKQLRKHRFRKEYFKIDVATALEVVQEACAFFNNQEEEQKKAEAAKRVADEARREEERREAEEATAAVEAEKRAPAERAKLTAEEEAAIHARLVESAERFKAASLQAEDEFLRQMAAIPLPPRAEKPRSSQPNAAAYSAQTPATHTVIGCPKCKQQLRVPTRADLILTCPACRHSFERTAAGQLLEHTSQTGTVQVPSNASTPWAAYLIAVFAVFMGFMVMSGRGRSNEVASAPALPTEEQRLLDDLQRYADSYRIPPPDPKGETELRAVERVAKSIQFKYVTTVRGERALNKDTDQQYIQDGMRKLACAKPELKALMQRGAIVQYRLYRKGRDTLITTIVCG